MDRASQAGPPALTLSGVSKRYAETTAVDDVSFEVGDGEFFTLVGPSGCGKTTTLRLIAGFEQATDGTLGFGGEDVTGVPPEDRDIGIVFQNYALFPHMTVGENVAYGLHFSDPPGSVSTDERVEELLDLVDLSGMGEREPEQLSGGQQQRVAIARALAPGPSVLLLDEPMSALDAELRENLRVQVRSIQRDLGITTVYVTHDQEEALAISDRVAVMRDGSPEQIAPPREIYREPATPFVARFVGDNNVFEGTVREVTEDGLARTTVRGARVAIDASEYDGEVERGDRLTFCVRPESFVIEDGGVDRPGGRGGIDTQNLLAATVESAEFLGETSRLHLSWAERELLARTRDPLTGEVRVGFDPEDVHVIERR